MNNKGASLIEIIVVIAILSILATIAIPRFAGFTEQAKIASDRAQVRLLNGATAIYRVLISKEDPFLDAKKTNDELITILIDDGLIDGNFSPQSKTGQFVWIFEAEQWVFTTENTAIYTLSTESGVRLGSGWSQTFLSGNYSGEASDVFIPTQLEDVTLTRIWQDVFTGKNLTSVSFDRNSQINRIHARAFQNNELTHIILPEQLQRVDFRAFNGNPIKEIVIPDTVITIEREAFMGLEKITAGSHLNFYHHPEGNVNLLENAINGNNLFRDAYLSENGGKGTYVFDGDKWLKIND